MIKKIIVLLMIMGMVGSMLFAEDAKVKAIDDVFADVEGTPLTDAEMKAAEGGFVPLLVAVLAWAIVGAGTETVSQLVQNEGKIVDPGAIVVSGVVGGVTGPIGGATTITSKVGIGIGYKVVYELSAKSVISGVTNSLAVPAYSSIKNHQTNTTSPNVQANSHK